MIAFASAFAIAVYVCCYAIAVVIVVAFAVAVALAVAAVAEDVAVMFCSMWPTDLQIIELVNSNLACLGTAMRVKLSCRMLKTNCFIWFLLCLVVDLVGRVW